MNANLPSNPSTVKGLLDKHSSALAEALPKHLPVNKLIRVCVTALNRNPTLQQCTQASLMGSILECALYGLEPDGREAALVPFRVKGVQTCTFMPMYAGRLKLARRSGEISLIYAEIVRQADVFEMKKGLNPDLIHEPALDGASEIIGAYAVYRLKSGEAYFVWMSKAEIDKIRKRSRAANNGPWVTDYPEMAKKTVLNRLCKVAPSATEKQEEFTVPERLSTALGTMALPTPSEHVEEMIDAPKEKSVTEGHGGPPEEDKTRPKDDAPTETVDIETGLVNETPGKPADYPDLPDPSLLNFPGGE